MVPKGQKKQSEDNFGGLFGFLNHARDGTQSLIHQASPPREGMKQWIHMTGTGPSGKDTENERNDIHMDM